MELNNCIKQTKKKSNNIATIKREKLKGDWALQEPLACPITQMQTLTRMDKVVIEDYYGMTSVDENVNEMKLTHVLLKNL